MWSEAAEAVKTYHEEMVAAWDKEMDTLLVYVRILPRNAKLKASL